MYIKLQKTNFMELLYTQQSMYIVTVYFEEESAGYMHITKMQSCQEIKWSNRMKTEMVLLNFCGIK